MAYTRLKNNNYIWISHLADDGLYFIIPTYPSTLTDPFGAPSYTPTSFMGRSAPTYSYMYTDARTISFTLQLHRDMFDDFNIPNEYLTKYKKTLKDDSCDTVDLLIKAITSIAIPKYSVQQRAVQPPTVTVKIADEVYISGIVNGEVTVTYMPPIVNYDGKDKYALVEIKFSVTEIAPYDAITLSNIGSFRNIVDFRYLSTSENKSSSSAGSFDSSNLARGDKSLQRVNLNSSINSGYNSVIGSLVSGFNNAYNSFSAIIDAAEESVMSQLTSTSELDSFSSGGSSSSGGNSYTVTNGKKGSMGPVQATGKDCTEFVIEWLMSKFNLSRTQVKKSLFPSGGYGNACTWYDSAFPACQTQTPGVDYVGCSFANDWSKYGHVWIVTSVNSDNTVNIIEGGRHINGLSGCVVERWGVSPQLVSSSDNRNSLSGYLDIKRSPVYAGYLFNS